MENRILRMRLQMDRQNIMSMDESAEFLKEQGESAIVREFTKNIKEEVARIKSNVGTLGGPSGTMMPVMFTIITKGGK